MAIHVSNIYVTPIPVQQLHNEAVLELRLETVTTRSKTGILLEYKLIQKELLELFDWLTIELGIYSRAC